MRIIFLPDWLTVASFFIVWPILQYGISLLVNRIPHRWFRPAGTWFRTHRFEDGGHIYQQLFRIRRWKKRLPDGASLTGVGLPKKTLQSRDREYLEEFIVETCRTEFMHELQILPFWVFGLWAPGFTLWIMLGYALIVNFPCIIAQRYNRPRLQRVYHRVRNQSQSYNRISTKDP